MYSYEVCQSLPLLLTKSDDMKWARNRFSNTSTQYYPQKRLWLWFNLRRSQGNIEERQSPSQHADTWRDELTRRSPTFDCIFSTQKCPKISGNMKAITPNSSPLNVDPQLDPTISSERQRFQNNQCLVEILKGQLQNLWISFNYHALPLTWIVLSHSLYSPFNEPYGFICCTNQPFLS